MRFFTAITLYRLLLPALFVAAFPGWIIKMWRRGGFRSHLGERTAIYHLPLEYDPGGAIHFHAVSVGESLLALKLIREWLHLEPGRRFVLATGTATGHALVTAANIPGLRVTYSPLDFPSMVRRYLDRFEPAQIILIEGEVWPHLVLECARRKLPVSLVNARMSPRSTRRFKRFAPYLRPIYQQLQAVAIQEPEDSGIWELLGIDRQKIHVTGSLKFDPGSGQLPSRRPQFQNMLDAFGASRPIILAASTHPGEEAWIVAAIREACPNALPVVAPRHAERRLEVMSELRRHSAHPILRSQFPRLLNNATLDDPTHVFIIDSTGELGDWTAHADVIIIGKSFLSTGGQNPCEAILAAKPVIFGPHMENFQPLAQRLVTAGACFSVRNQEELAAAIAAALEPQKALEMTCLASAALARHRGATQRILELLTAENSPPF
jgi:3-deoxy-D-manno-octulosonic-acid transferase